MRKYYVAPLLAVLMTSITMNPVNLLWTDHHVVAKVSLALRTGAMTGFRLENGTQQPPPSGVRTWNRRSAAHVQKTAANTAPPQAAPTPTTGLAKMLVVCVAFKGKPATEPLSVYRQLYFGKTGSVADYYRQVSYGKFQLTGTVIGDPLHPGAFLTLPHSEAYYAEKDNGTGSPFPHNDNALVVNVIHQLIADHFDFAPYAANGKVQYLAFVFSGYGADVEPTDTRLIWPVEDQLPTPLLVPLTSPQASTQAGGGAGVNSSGAGGPGEPGGQSGGQSAGAPGGVGSAGNSAAASANVAMVSTYDLVPELSDSSMTPTTIGVLAHELGHLLGLDDLYDTSSSAKAGQGDGPWSLMADGNWNGYPAGSSPAELDPFSRIFLGWIDPQVIAESETGVILPPIEEKPVVYELRPAGKETDYFLISNEQQISFDQALPESGVLIWHIDGAQATPDSYDWRNDVLNTPRQNATHHDDIAIVEAGHTGDLHVPLDISGTYNDTYPSPGGNNSFTATSNPNNDLWNGQSLGMDVTRITVQKNGVATFNVRDAQSGSSLVIVPPKTGMTVYQGQKIPLVAQFQHGGQTVALTNASGWFAPYDSVTWSGATADFHTPGIVTVSIWNHGLPALAYFNVIALKTLMTGPAQESVQNGRIFVALPRLTAYYANGKILNVTALATWSFVTSTGATEPAVLVDNKYLAGAGGAALPSNLGGSLQLVASFAGQTVSSQVT